MKQSYDKAIGDMRAIAIILIVLHHSIISLQGWPPVDYEYSPEVPFLISKLSQYSKTFGLGIFTFISGFLINKYHSNRSYIKFVYYKFKKILLPCIITAFFYYFFFPDRMYNNDPVNGTHLWYLPMIFVFYLLAPILNSPFSLKSSLSLLIIFVLFYFLYKLTYFRTFGACFYYFGYFVSGVCFSRIHRLIPKSFNISSFIAFLTLLVFFLDNRIESDLTVAIYICILYLFIQTRFKTNSIILQHISRASFFIYLVHQFIINGIIDLQLSFHFPLIFISLGSFFLSLMIPTYIYFLKVQYYNDRNEK